MPKRHLIALVLLLGGCGLEPNISFRKKSSGHEADAVAEALRMKFIPQDGTGYLFAQGTRWYLYPTADEQTALVGDQGAGWLLAADGKAAELPGLLKPTGDFAVYNLADGHVWILSKDLAKHSLASLSEQSESDDLLQISAVSIAASDLQRPVDLRQPLGMADDYLIYYDGDSLTELRFEDGELTSKTISIPAEAALPPAALAAGPCRGRSDCYWLYNSAGFRAFEVTQTGRFLELPFAHALEVQGDEALTSVSPNLRYAAGELTSDLPAFATSAAALLRGMRAQDAAGANLTWAADVQPLAAAYCLPCHGGSKGEGTNPIGLENESDWLGSKDEIILRVSNENQDKTAKELGNRQVMPPKANRPQYPISASERQKLVLWLKAH